MIEMHKVIIPCSLCGEDYIDYMIDGHITYPHICETCLRSILKQWEQSPKCVECRHCTYIHEYEQHWCEALQFPVDIEFRSGGCVTYEKKEEE